MIINLKSENDLSGFYVVYNGSTNLEKPGWRGISHLMEHLMCKNFDHLQDDFLRDGINWNAYTSPNEIVFYLTGLDENVNKWKYEFIDLLSGFDVTKEDFENERKIVMEEYMDTFNSQTSSHQLNLMRKGFNAFNPIGLREDLEKMKFMDCLNYFEVQYSRPSKIINVSKHKNYKNNLIDFSDNLIDKKFEFGNFEVPLELNNKFKDKTSLFMLSPVVNDDFAYINFINSMLSLGLKSPLYNEIREKRGLVYYIHLYMSRMNNQGVINIATQTSNRNFEILVDSIKSVIENPDKFLTKDRFKLVKDFYNVKFKKNEILRYENVSRWINPSGFSVYDIIEDINFYKIREIYEKYYQFDNFYISNDKDEFL